MDKRVVEISSSVQSFLAKPIGMLIDGELVMAADGSTFETHDPATGELLAGVPRAKAADVDKAAIAAKRAFDGPWRRASPREKSALLLKLADLIERDAEEFAELESLDNGKPRAYALAGDLASVIDHLRYFAGWPSKIEGDTLPVSNPDMHVYTRREPVGVVGAIVPWNFPLLMAVWKLAPALAAGCTVVLKPAEQTPLTALRLGELILEAGFPAGVANICPGFGEEAGRAIVAHPLIHKIAFTGSTAVGQEIAQLASEHLKHVTLELGGKSPNIVLADADIGRAAAGAAQAIFYESGQVCSAGSRLMVHASILDEMIEALKGEVQKLRPGRGIDPTSTLGPLVSEAQFKRVDSYVRSGISEGANVVVGGGGIGGDLSAGHFFQPTILNNVPDHMTICREEIFGPVLVVQSFSDIDEAISRANAQDYGLAAGLWTKNLSNAHRFAAAIEAGNVWVNCYNAFDPSIPFGGYKKSGYGRDGGKSALDKFLQIKSVWINLS